jgi:hypothetical protein
MKIVAIGGNVIKTAWDEIKEVANRRLFDVLIHNGGSIFHDFQRATEDLPGHSYPLDDLIIDYECNRKASELVWHWINTGFAPDASLTRICSRNGIEVLMFTALAADFWQLFNGSWETLAMKTKKDFEALCNLMKQPFHYICMGSAVIHPEVFVKALAVAKPKQFQADVVDFLPNQYRPKTRVAKYGNYYCSSHQEYLVNWLESERSKNRK